MDFRSKFSYLVYSRAQDGNLARRVVRISSKKRNRNETLPLLYMDHQQAPLGKFSLVISDDSLVPAVAFFILELDRRFVSEGTFFGVFFAFFTGGSASGSGAFSSATSSTTSSSSFPFSSACPFPFVAGISSATSSAGGAVSGSVSFTASTTVSVVAGAAAAGVSVISVIFLLLLFQICSKESWNFKTQRAQSTKPENRKNESRRDFQ